MKRIAELRKEKHLTQIALGMKLNVSQNMISFYETGKYQPSLDILIALSKLFEVSVDYLIENSNVRYSADCLIKEDYTIEEMEMMQLFKTLSKEKQQRAIGMIQALGKME